MVWRGAVREGVFELARCVVRGVARGGLVEVPPPADWNAASWVDWRGEDILGVAAVAPGEVRALLGNTLPATLEWVAEPVCELVLLAPWEKVRDLLPHWLEMSPWPPELDPVTGLMEAI